MDIAGSVNIISNGVIMDALFNSKKTKSVDDITKDMLVSNEPIEDKFSETLVNKEDSAAISDFASKLSTVDAVLKLAGNTKGSDGLREIAKQFASSPENFSKFMKSAGNLEQESFQKVFSTADDLADNGLSVEKFTNTISSLSDEKSAEGFLNSTNKILDDAGSGNSDKETAFDKLNSAVKTIENNEDLDQTEKDEALAGLFSSLSKTENLTDFSSVLDGILK